MLVDQDVYISACLIRPDFSRGLRYQICGFMGGFELKFDGVFEGCVFGYFDGGGRLEFVPVEDDHVFRFYSDEFF